MQKKSIVTIGGGTGSFMLLSGLKKYNVNLTAVVSMADDGGSTGVLRDEMGVLPPGDVRQCLVALSDSPEILRNLMSYRFEEGALAGHSFGNLMISALERITGDFGEAINAAEEILHVNGKVIPVTKDKAHLQIILKDNKIISGENEINHSNLQKIGVKKIFYDPLVNANQFALEKINMADVIVIGPGNLYCSILPNIIIKGIGDAIKKSKAIVIYNTNLTNKKGHTEKFAVYDYVNEIEKYIGKNRINFVTHNTVKPLQSILTFYEKQEGVGTLVKWNEIKNQKRFYRLIQGNYISHKQVKYHASDKIAHLRSLIRHDSDKLAKAIMYIAEQNDYAKIIKKIS